ncbi:MAG: hypothetical protein HWD59_06315 [Coxiellaceae bacterium]|nr:MAG: hypothetical protein HWD59_06315 [Coxiellaceae bacterium]
MPTFNKPTQEKLQKNAVKFAAAVYKAQAGNQAEAEVAKAKLKQEAILNKATNQWGYGRGPILSIFHGLNTAKNSMLNQL